MKKFYDSLKNLDPVGAGLVGLLLGVAIFIALDNSPKKAEAAIAAFKEGKTLSCGYDLNVSAQEGWTLSKNETMFAYVESEDGSYEKAKIGWAYTHQCTPLN